ncbi:hypothetical protein HAX54_049303 [Datura stramonium]|uniref:Secreted protein n=1 Tax=Datura stramonium TaxID=4076 RepID=A0ABS8WMH9_DATST|nr:hypothetical protein [Datura stramonium]
MFNMVILCIWFATSPACQPMVVHPLAQVRTCHSTGTDGISPSTHGDFERDLRQNLNVDDLRVRHRTMQTIQTMIHYVGRYFVDLGHVMT